MLTGRQNALLECKHTNEKKWSKIDPIMKFPFAKQSYEKHLQLQFDTLYLVTTADKFKGNIVREAAGVGVKLIGMKDIKQLLKRHNITTLQVQRRLLSDRISF